MTTASRRAPFIDYGSTPPVPGISMTAQHLSNYRRVYRASESASEAIKNAPEPLSAYLAEYDALNARHVIVKARDLETTFNFRVKNEDVARFCKENGPRFIGFAGVDPNKGMTAVRELEFAVRELGLRGLNLQCFEHKLRINDAKMFPLYAKCIELDVPVNIHCGTNFSVATSMDYGRPIYLDDVMIHFPELRVCASPPGFPWVAELITVAWRHANVNIGLVAIRHKYLAVPNSGYEMLLQYGNSVLQDQIIYGSAYPMMPVRRSLAEIDELPLKDVVRQKWIHDNAARLIGLI
jgi:predicted TIM-barrel fold metal-dependent hydrolase